MDNVERFKAVIEGVACFCLGIVIGCGLIFLSGETARAVFKPGSSIIAETQMRYDTTQARLFTKDHKKDCTDDITDTQVMEHLIWQNDQILERMK